MPKEEIDSIDFTVSGLEFHRMQKLNGRDQECQGLSRTRSRCTEHVLPRKKRRNRFLLDRRHGLEAHLFETFHCRLRELQRVERHSFCNAILWDGGRRDF